MCVRAFQHACDYLHVSVFWSVLCMCLCNHAFVQLRVFGCGVVCFVYTHVCTAKNVHFGV